MIGFEPMVKSEKAAEAARRGSQKYINLQDVHRELTEVKRELASQCKMLEQILEMLEQILEAVKN